MGMAGGVLGMATCRVPNRVRWHLVSPSPTYISRAICFTQSIAIISSGLTSLSLSRSLSLARSLSLSRGQSGRRRWSPAVVRSMEWWQKAVVVPVKRAWIVVAARLRRKKDGNIIILCSLFISVSFFMNVNYLCMPIYCLNRSVAWFTLWSTCSDFIYFSHRLSLMKRFISKIRLLWQCRTV